MHKGPIHDHSVTFINGLLDFIWLNSCSVTQIHKICFAGKSEKITKKISPNFNFLKVKKIEGQLKKS